MNKFARLAVVGTLGLIACMGVANAQGTKAPFDAQKFWEEMENRGVQAKGIDANKFWEEMETRGSKGPTTPKEFFAELQKKGAQITDKNFDADKFWEDMERRGVKMPPLKK
jgi:hypothetical protein